MTQKKNKYEKAEDFIGWKSEDGKLEVVGIHGKQGTFTLFKVSCSECSEDSELFPEKYFTCYKSTLVGGYKPCGCGKNTRWEPWQFRLKAKRQLGDFVNFTEVGKYSGSRTKLRCVCTVDGKVWNTTYRRVLYSKQSCPECALNRHRQITSFHGYYPERKDETDFLYILNFDNKFIKVGRSFDVDERLKGLRDESKVPKNKIHKLRIFTAIHQEIYDFEQEIHTELRDRNFQHYVDWSTECFENDSLYILNKMLDECGLEEV